MTKRYPRRYLVVEDGKFERVVVRDSAQELGIMLRHAEALGLNRYKPYDLNQDVVPDTGEREES